MRPVRLAYRDRDRLPLIACIREMARRHYDVDVVVVRIQPTGEYEAALFDDRCDLIVEHLEFLYARAAAQAAAHPETEATMFCAPVDRTGVELMALPAVKDASELRGKTVAVRSSGRPDSLYMRLKAAGLDPSDTVLVPDSEVGRGYDFVAAVRYFTEVADLILFFFDPDKPGTTGETMQVFTQALSGMDHKMLIVLNKVDRFSNMRDFARAYGARAGDLLGDAKALDDLGHDFGAGLYEREVDYLTRNEWARTGEDILWRRGKLGLRCGAGTEAAIDAWLAGDPDATTIRAGAQ